MHERGFPIQKCLFISFFLLKQRDFHKHMMVQKLQKPIKKEIQVQLRLPQIHSRQHLRSVKKSQFAAPFFPQINRNFKNENDFINKENNSDQNLDPKSDINQEIMNRVCQVENAKKIVKNLLGNPESTVNIGGDLTNFQLKVEANKKNLKEQRLRIDLKAQSPKFNFEQKKQCLTSQKNKRFSSRDIIRQKSEPQPIKQQIMLKIHEFNQSETGLSIKNKKNPQGQETEQLNFKTQRRTVNNKNLTKEQNSQVFQSIKEILSNPQKNIRAMSKKLTKRGKHTIEELRNRLKEMSKIQSNKSFFEENDRKIESDSMRKKLISSKSVRVIPFSASEAVNWNKVEISDQNQEDGQRSNKVIKYLRSNFDTEVQQIQKLEMRSYKSIEKMVENRKLLIDLQLMKKNRNLLPQSKKKKRQLSIKQVKKQESDMLKVFFQRD